MTLNKVRFIFVNETEVKLILFGNALVNHVPENTIILYRKDNHIKLLKKTPLV